MTTDNQQQVVVANNPGESLCLSFRHQIERALSYELISGTMTFGNFLSAVAEDVDAQPKLAAAFRASPATALACLLHAAQCKLLVGSRYEQFYLIPRLRRKGYSSAMEVTSLIGYKGLMEMAKRHPRVHSIAAHLVYEGEPFDWQPGANRLHHVWRRDVDRSPEKIVAAYARAVITEPNSTRAVTDDPIFEVMTRGEIDGARAKSESYRSAETGYDGKPPRRDSPWHTHYDRMARKTVLRRLLSGGSVPRDMGVSGIIQKDDAMDLVERPDNEEPQPTRGEQVRRAIGIGVESAKAPPFDLAEEAIEAIRAAGSAAELAAMKPRWQHLAGSDAESVRQAYEARLEELG